MFERVPKAYWLWGQFAPADMATLEAIQHTVHGAIGGPEFGIHVTLAGPIFTLEAGAHIHLKGLCAQQSPLTLRTQGYRMSPNKYTAFYVGLEKSPELLRLRQDLIEAFGISGEQDYDPHASLYYGFTPENQKQVLLEQLPVLPGSVRLEKIALVDVDEDVDRWEILSTYFLGK